MKFCAKQQFLFFYKESLTNTHKKDRRLIYRPPFTRKLSFNIPSLQPINQREQKPHNLFGTDREVETKTDRKGTPKKL